MYGGPVGIIFGCRIDKLVISFDEHAEMDMKKLSESPLDIEPVNVNDISLNDILTAIRESREGREEPEGRDR